MENVIETEIKDLRQTRGRLRSQLTRFQTFLNTSNDPIELEVRLTRIESAFDRFDEIQSRLETLNVDEEEQREDQESLYYELISKAKGILMKNHASQTPQDL